MLSVSVIAPTGMIADAITKIVMLNPSGSASVLTQLGAAALICDPSGTILCSSNWNENSRLRLSVLAELSVYAVFGLLLATGAMWMFAQTQLGEGGQASSLMLKVHGGAAMAALVVIGALIAHIRSGWRAQRNRVSGLTLLLAILFLVITGYGLYYAGDEQLRSLISRWHAWIGLGLFGLLPAHVLIGRARRRRRDKRAIETQTGAPSQPSDSRTDLSVSSSARPCHSETPHHPE